MGSVVLDFAEVVIRHLSGLWQWITTGSAY